MSNFPFPTVFSTLLKNFLPFSSNSTLLSTKPLSLEGSKICHFGKVKKYRASECTVLIKDLHFLHKELTLYSIDAHFDASTTNSF